MILKQGKPNHLEDHTETLAAWSMIWLRHAHAKIALRFLPSLRVFVHHKSQGTNLIYIFVVVAQNTQAGLMGPRWCRRAEPLPVVTSRVFAHEVSARDPGAGPPERKLEKSPAETSSVLN